MRRRFIAGNWKMNKTSKEAIDFLRYIIPRVKDNPQDIVIAAPFTSLCTMKAGLGDSRIMLAGQDIFYEDQGPYTGEISGQMLKEFADYVIIGHSERRKIFREDDDMINKKIRAALKSGLKVIFCLGESLEDRLKKKTRRVVQAQFIKGTQGLGPSDMKNIIIAYEPVWAIGTGKTATPQEAEDVHLLLRRLVEESFGSPASKNNRIIYGGSVMPENTRELMQQPDIDGCLVGGASLDPKRFLKIIKASK